MKLQTLIEQIDLAMTLPQVKAFFLGIQSAEKPLPFNQAMEELLSDVEVPSSELEPELKKLWDELQKNKSKELGSLFPKQNDVNEFLNVARDQLDYYLSALSLSGTSSDKCKDEELAD